MADQKITALTALGAAPASDDLLAIVDTSAPNVTKKITVANLCTVYNRGLVSYNTNIGTGTQTIAHGLSKTPKKIHIHAMWVQGATIATSHGHATAIGNEGCNYNFIGNSGGATNGGQNASSIIELDDTSNAVTTAEIIANVSVLDATNITLDFTTVSNGGSDFTFYVEWEAEA